MSRVLEELKQIARRPANDGDLWLASAEDGVRFLKEHLQGDTTVLYAALSTVLIHGVLVSLVHLDSIDRRRLSTEFVAPDDSWIIEHVSGGGEPDRVYLAPPLRRLGEPLEQGDKLVFRRHFAGHDGDATTEINQKLVHALDLHFVEERNAWCRLDDDGDIIDVIKIVRETFEDWTQNICLVTILTKDFAEYMRLSGMGMLYFFDFTRTRPGSFNGWNDVTPVQFDAPDLFYHGGVTSNSGSYINGRMIVRPALTYEDVVKTHVEKRDPTNRQYATFKAIDLKTKEQIEISADPKGLSNYSQPQSPLPLEMSPAFFRGEVLHRYKADPTKYDLEDRAISCRGAWALRTYDVNSEGQVHTYLRHLGELPFKEQLYWQSFNEWPKGGLSKRAITTDFKGEYYEGYDPLFQLKRLVIKLDETAPSWWQPRGDRLRKAVRYPITSSQEEWANEILALDQFVNEGLLLAPLKGLASKLGVKTQVDWRAFKVLEELVAKISEDRVDPKITIDPLRRLRDLRNHLKGHASDHKKVLAKEAIAKHGSFRAHFESITDDAHGSMKVISTLLPSK